MRTTLVIENNIARLTLDDGKVNAMSFEMLDEISTQLDAARAGAQVTIISGRPGIFSAGFDMPTFADGLEPSLKMMVAGGRLIVAMLTHPHPIVTACTGHAYPMGAFLMLCADLRYGIDGAFSIGMNEVPIGLTVPKFALELAEHRLNRSGFAAVATGRMFTPDEAVAAGYLDYVVSENELFDAAGAAAERLSSINMAAYAATKARINGTAVERIRALTDPSALGAELLGLSNI